jgi:hypothetical protein
VVPDKPDLIIATQDNSASSPHVGERGEINGLVTETAAKMDLD